VLRNSLNSRQFVFYTAIGTVEWLALAAVEGRYVANYSGVPYVFALVITALALGAIDPKMPNLRAGIFLVAPALVLALWTAPRGDNDGLWMLWFPILLVLIFVVAGSHTLGARIGRRR
jgi:hypothetical protein